MKNNKRAITDNSKKIEYLFYFFCSALLLLKFPPLYILGEMSKLGTTHMLGKIILMGVFCVLLILYKKNKAQLIPKGSIFLLLIAHLITSSLSVVRAVNVSHYLQQYQNIIFGILIFIISYTLVQRVKKEGVVIFLTIVGITVMLYDIFYALFTLEMLRIFKPVLQEEMYALYQFNLQNNKYNLYLSTEAFLPFLTLLLSRVFKKYIKILSIISMFTLGMLAIFSNFRTRFIQYIFSFGSVILNSKRVFNKSTFLMFTLIIMILGVFLMYIRNNTSYDIMNRFALDEQEDAQTIQYRFDTFTQSISMLKYSPLVGIGLGNYKAYIGYSNTSGILNQYSRLHAEETISNPHSVFMQILIESGLLGFLSYVLLLLFFLKIDVKTFIIKQHPTSPLLVSCIIASWTIFLYGIFNPFNSVFLNGWFWYFRGLVQGIVDSSRHRYEY